MRSLTSLSLIAVLALPMPSAVALKPDTHHRLAQLDASAELPSQLRDRLLQYIHQTTAVPMADLAIVDYCQFWRTPSQKPSSA